MPPESKTVTEIDGHRLTLTNLAKVLYPDAGFTKAAVIDYYARIAPVLLPHLAGRALTMVRWPDGVTGPSFFEKRCPPHAPKWVRTGSGYPGVISCVVDDTASLVWAANLAALELHTLQARVDDPDHPTSMVLDLDPGAPAGLLDCCRGRARAARDARRPRARERREVVGLARACTWPSRRRARPRTRRRPSRGRSGSCSRQRDPERVTVLMNRDLRAGKVFVDWSQNDRHKTTVCAYSLRAQPRPQVSAPLSWDEVADAHESGDASGLVFEAAEVLERVATVGDLYDANVTVEQELPRFDTPAG